jgi:hypothetical protein
MSQPIKNADDILLKRITQLKEWLLQNGQGCQHRQAHLDAGSIERVYWHYGYLMALQDVRRLLAGDSKAFG